MLSVYGIVIDIFFILSGLKLKINVDKGFGLMWIVKKIF